MDDIIFRYRLSTDEQREQIHRIIDAYEKVITYITNQSQIPANAKKLMISEITNETLTELTTILK